MIKFRVLLISLWLLAAAPALVSSDYGHLVVSTDVSHCVVFQDKEQRVELSDLVQTALARGCYSIRIEDGVWEMTRPVVIEQNRQPVVLEGNSRPGAVQLRRSKGPAVVIREAGTIVLRDLSVQGGIELDRTQDVTINNLTVQERGITLRGKTCNQPSECDAFNRDVTIENCTFVDCDTGILAERMEASTIRENRFTGNYTGSACNAPVGIQLDGTSEDVDRRFEYGHNKANLVVGNLFTHSFAVGVSVRYSRGNVFRDNRFFDSFRAYQFQEGAWYNQVESSYIGYLSQNAVTSSCPSPCAIFLGSATVGNVFTNNLFEQALELQFLERHRNRVGVVDESGGRNLFKSDLTSPSTNRQP